MKGINFEMGEIVGRNFGIKKETLVDQFQRKRLGSLSGKE